MATSLAPPIGRQETLPLLLESPCHPDGGFFFDNPRAFGIIVETVTPRVTKPLIEVDPSTGMPYPIIVPEDMTDISGHHHFFPELSSELTETDGGRSVRLLYIQKLGRRLHNLGAEALHEKCSILTELPKTQDEHTGTVIFGEALYLPRKGLDLNFSTPRPRYLRTAEFARLRHPDSWAMRPIMRTDVENFVAVHERWRRKKHRPHSQEPPIIHDFLSRVVIEMTPNVDNYDNLSKAYAATLETQDGYQLLREAARLVTETTVFHGETIAVKYKRAWLDGQLLPGLPKDSSDFLLSRLGSQYSLAKVLAQLAIFVRGEEKLVA